MESQSISSLFNLSSNQQSTSTSPGGALGRDEFLELLTIQLQYQDPLNPISNQEFAAQLAQFSSLEQMQQMNETLATELMVAESSHNAMATEMIGKNVRVFGDSFAVGDDGEAPTLMVHPSTTGPVDVRITDASGTLVRSLTMDLESTDPVEIEWDGRDGEGEPLAAGQYQVAVTAAAAGDGALPMSTYIVDRVTGIRFDGGVTELMLGTVPYTLADVIEIRA
jgi:flagellar basal-body rod modification protein FlgD